MNDLKRFDTVATVWEQDLLRQMTAPWPLTEGYNRATSLRSHCAE